MSTLKPLDDRVFVEVIEQTKSPSGKLDIVRMTNKQTQFDQQYTGRVIAVGPGLPHKADGRHASSLKPGDVVIWKGWTHQEVVVDGWKLKEMRERDILAKVC